MSSEHILWILFCLIFVVVSTVDYQVTSHRCKPISVRQALYWTGLWISLALLFGLAILFLHPQGKTLAPLYIAGYLTEYSLSVDNLFVFILIFQLMGVLDRAASGGRKITLEFRHDPDDDMMIEFAEDMKTDYVWLNIELLEVA